MPDQQLPHVTGGPDEHDSTLPQRISRIKFRHDRFGFWNDGPVRGFMQPLMGRFSDRTGKRRRVIVFGIATAAVCAFMIPVLENFGLLSMIIMFLLVGVGLLEGIRSSVLAAAVEFTGNREGTTLGFAFTLMDGLGAFGALLAGWAAGIQFSHAFLLAGILCSFSLILCFSVSLRSASLENPI